VLQKAAPLTTRLSHSFARALRQRSCGKTLEQTQVNTNGIGDVALGIELRIAGLAPKPCELCARAHETAQKHSNIKKIFPLLRRRFFSCLLKPHHETSH
jgi:hypothetical protein